MAAINDQYIQVVTPGEFILKERRSTFIAQAFPVITPEMVRTALYDVSRRYPDARHSCWGYRLGYPETSTHCSDDGEPSGSAGRPILGAIVQADIYDVIVIVTRYFGGVKLGVRGLIDAYSEAASAALTRCTFREAVATTAFSFKTTYDRYGDVLHHLTSFGLPEASVHPHFSEIVDVKMDVPLSLEISMTQLLNNLKNRSLVSTWEQNSRVST
ncbi:MAG: YigZ family protein [Dethiosulfovibrio peptidovorans]|nr:MAG: YigZ family protein [Dethiosulfovibrio peptidovorans]